MEITPSDSINTDLMQNVKIRTTNFIRNQGQNYGLIHST